MKRDWVIIIRNIIDTYTIVYLCHCVKRTEAYEGKVGCICGCVFERKKCVHVNRMAVMKCFRATHVSEVSQTHTHKHTEILKVTLHNTLSLAVSSVERLWKVVKSSTCETDTQTTSTLIQLVLKLLSMFGIFVL